MIDKGQVLTGIEIGPVAHGGHFVARYEGRVIFVRGALSGEIVDVRITEVVKKFARGEVVAVRQGSPHRIPAACPIAERCGGCDFQHAEVSHTRELKRQVVGEQLRHLAGYEFTGEVVAVEPTPFTWRTRMRYHLDADGRVGLLGHRSREVVPLPDEGCRLAVAGIAAPRVNGLRGGQVVAAAAASQTVVLPADDCAVQLREQVAGRRYQVWADGFWQAHLAAAEVLVAEVLAGLAPMSGETAVDLYCGVGLFAGALDGLGARVLGIEGDRRAAELAAVNVPHGQFLCGDVSALVDRLPNSIDIAVLDPPRAGAGPGVLAGLLARRPRAVAYVACDPAALGRDLRIAADLGYRPTSVRAFDLFPLTHHVECVAILKPL
jgi:tRNA/tmRNA/rRNA uracil-C5-methylase (TrmA/RlmC/RlmD family)